MIDAAQFALNAFVSGNKEDMITLNSQKTQTQNGDDTYVTIKKKSTPEPQPAPKTASQPAPQSVSQQDALSSNDTYVVLKYVQLPQQGVSNDRYSLPNKK